MLISMTPNEEVKTIHASLNDGSLRKWEFEPYTEQGKIELTDQDYATIQSIKGNTVKFNQLVQNGNFESANGWASGSGTLTVSNNVARVTFTGSAWNNDLRTTLQLTVSHKYYIAFDYLMSSGLPNGLNFDNSNIIASFPNSHTKTRGKAIFTYSVDDGSTKRLVIQGNVSTYANEYFEVSNFILIDLTLIFGSGNEPSTVEEFETWLSNNIGLLPYYAYTPGTLIPFKGTGLKTTGKNLLEIIVQGSITETGSISSTAKRVCSNDYIKVIPNATYILSGQYKTSGTVNCLFRLFANNDGSENISFTNWLSLPETITIPENVNYIQFALRLGGGTENISPEDFSLMQFEIGSNVSSYEPYTSNTLSLPISTLFPTGMKSAGSVYDELTSSKATTRVGSVDLGSLRYSYYENYKCFITDDITNKITPSTSELPTLECSMYRGITWNSGATDATKDMTICFLINNPQVRIRNLAYDNPATFKQAMSGVMLYYELATPTSQDISLDLTYPIWNDGTEQILPVNSSTPTTSPLKATIDYPDRTEDVDFLYKQTTFESAIPQFSLVCKNQELPMTLEDGKLICECDSSITNESGFFDCKVKMQDLNSVAYSQKIQLHVERGIND